MWRLWRYPSRSGAMNSDHSPLAEEKNSMRCCPNGIRWQSATPFLSESYTTILFSCCVMVIASGKRLWAACKTRLGLQPKIVFESGQFSSILSMVSAGLGVSIISCDGPLRSGVAAASLRSGTRRATRTIGSVTLHGKTR